MFLLLFLNHWHIPFNSCSCKTRNFYKHTKERSKAEIEMHPVIAEAKIKKYSP